MNNKTTITVSVTDYMGETFAYSKDIEPRLIQSFEPMDVCDDEYVAGIVGGVPRKYAAIITARREGFAKELSSEITDGLMKFIERKDTVNGYREQP